MSTRISDYGNGSETGRAPPQPPSMAILNIEESSSLILTCPGKRNAWCARSLHRRTRGWLEKGRGRCARKGRLHLRSAMALG